jgi:hypothetical protein
MQVHQLGKKLQAHNFLGGIKMEIKLNITAGQVITVLVIALLAGGIGYLLPKETSIENQYAGFSGKDLNILGNVAYLSGHCERLGLVSSVFVQDFNGTKYGVPVCLDKSKGVE